LLRRGSNEENPSPGSRFALATLSLKGRGEEERGEGARYPAPPQQATYPP
jgi:hypothetical protein